MNFDQLMQCAKDINDKALELAMTELSQKKSEKFPGSNEYNQIRQRYAFIEPLFEPFSRLPDPTRYDPLIADLNAAMGNLRTESGQTTELTKDVSLANPHLDKMTTDGGYLQGWNGEAAMAFKANFIDTFKTISGNQFAALSTLKGVLQAHQEMWSTARKDITKIANDTKDALDNAGGCDKNEWSFAFSVLSAVTAVGGVVVTVATAGAGLPVTFPAIGAASSTGSAAIAGITASGDSADTIINSMRQAVDDLTKHIQEVETQHIELKIRGLIDCIHGNKDRLVSTRPNLAGMNDRDLTGDRGMGKSD
ncbi:hypothetical protein [Amycolatopsis sp. CA-230715]|uniref:hypothetical protein n=1 Tax=Amycolatopsis sp. CA-230715 TaxID=2745196 RepID=UPI001C0165E2|nr:hypothetical protein [Amycolatopsis sp. CA-230715]QWF79449.1 hypothetical protein HUW46_02857 [Amycolatopsis sp. CA-230715]